MTGLPYRTICVCGEGLEFATASGATSVSNLSPVRKLAFVLTIAYAIADRDTGGPVVSYRRTVRTPIRDLSRAVAERDILIEQAFDFAHLRRLLAAAAGDQPGIFVCTGDGAYPGELDEVRKQGTNLRCCGSHFASCSSRADDLQGVGVKDHRAFRLSWIPRGSGMEEELLARYESFETLPEMLLPDQPTGIPGAVEMLTLDPESRVLCVFADGAARTRLVDALCDDPEHPAFFARVTEGDLWKWVRNACPEWQIAEVDMTGFL